MASESWKGAVVVWLNRCRFLLMAAMVSASSRLEPWSSRTIAVIHRQQGIKQEIQRPTGVDILIGDAEKQAGAEQVDDQQKQDDQKGDAEPEKHLAQAADAAVKPEIHEQTPCKAYKPRRGRADSIGEILQGAGTRKYLPIDQKADGSTGQTTPPAGDQTQYNTLYEKEPEGFLLPLFRGWVIPESVPAGGGRSGSADPAAPVRRISPDAGRTGSRRGSSNRCGSHR